MAPLFDHVMFNATAAAVLAPVAYASKWLRRPALTHILWLVVLVRLIAPPLYTLSLPEWFGTGSATDSPNETVQNKKEPVEDSPASEPALELYEWIDEPVTTLLASTAVDIDRSDVTGEPQQQWAAFAWTDVPWTKLTLATWVIVSLCIVVVIVSRAWRFRRAIDTVVGGDARLTRLVAILSRRVGLPQPPRVLLLSNRISPCVWAGFLRPTLALPADWLDGLTRLQQSAVLVHELAHLRRRDHWVRWLESAVVALCWWHPITWVARRELREAEELCCDGWVVATLPAARRAYADALVDTLDFLATARPALPPLASGFGQVHELKRRIHMILKANPAYRSGRAGALVALGLALCLPFGVARSDEPQDNPPPPPPPPPERPNDTPPPSRPREVRGFEIDGDGRRVVEGRALARTAQNRGDSNSDELERLREEMQKAQEQMAQAQQRMERLHRRMEELGAKAHGATVASATQPRFGGGGASGEWRRGNDADLEKKMLKLRLQEMEALETFSDNHPNVQKLRKEMDALKRATTTTGPAREGPRGGGPVGPVPHAPPMPPVTPTPAVSIPSFRGVPSFSPFGATEAGRPSANSVPAPGGDQRIDELAKAVAELKRAIDEMRRDRDRDRRPPQPQP